MFKFSKIKLTPYEWHSQMDWCLFYVVFFNYISYTESTEWTAVNGELEGVCREVADGYLQLRSWNWYGGPARNC